MDRSRLDEILFENRLDELELAGNLTGSQDLDCESRALANYMLGHPDRGTRELEKIENSAWRKAAFQVLDRFWWSQYVSPLPKWHTPEFELSHLAKESRRYALGFELDAGILPLLQEVPKESETSLFAIYHLQNQGEPLESLELSKDCSEREKFYCLLCELFGNESEGNDKPTVAGKPIHETVDYAFLHARERRLKHDTGSAIGALEKAVKEAPDRPYLRVMLATLYAEQDEYTKAEQEAYKVLEAHSFQILAINVLKESKLRGSGNFLKTMWFLISSGKTFSRHYNSYTEFSWKYKPRID
jgi:hypothetical protein